MDFGARLTWPAFDWRPPSRYGPIGFDLADEALNLFQVAAKNGTYRIQAAVSVPYANGRENLLASPKRFRDFVRTALRSSPFKGRRVVSCLPAGRTRLLNVSYRKSALNEEEVLAKAVLDRLGGRLEDYVIDYIPIRGENREPQEKKALLAICDYRETIDYLELLTGAGLDAVALEVGPAALRRLVAAMDRKNTFSTVLLINCGRGSSFLTVMTGRRLVSDTTLADRDDLSAPDQNKALMLDREVIFGETRLLSHLSTVFDITSRQAGEMLLSVGFEPPAGATPRLDGEERELAITITEVLKPLFIELEDEVNKALIYTASETRGASIERIYLLGSIARYPGVSALLSEMFSLPVEVVDPLRQFEADPKIIDGIGPVAGIALAAGMALRGMG